MDPRRQIQEAQQAEGGSAAGSDGGGGGGDDDVRHLWREARTMLHSALAHQAA